MYAAPCAKVMSHEYAPHLSSSLEVTHTMRLASSACKKTRASKRVGGEDDGDDEEGREGGRRGGLGIPTRARRHRANTARGPGGVCVVLRCKDAPPPLLPDTLTDEQALTSTAAFISSGVAFQLTVLVPTMKVPRRTFPRMTSVAVAGMVPSVRVPELMVSVGTSPGLRWPLSVWNVTDHTYAPVVAVLDVKRVTST